MPKVLCLGINDREIRSYVMEYIPQSVPQVCVYKQRGKRDFKVFVTPSHLFYLYKWRLNIPVIRRILGKTPRPTFIFNMLDRESMKLIDEGSAWFLGRSLDTSEAMEDVDAEMANQLDYLTESSFWEGLSGSMEISLFMKLVIMGAGIGAWEMIKSLMSMMLG